MLTGIFMYVYTFVALKLLSFKNLRIQKYKNLDVQNILLFATLIKNINFGETHIRKRWSSYKICQVKVCKFKERV